MALGTLKSRRFQKMSAKHKMAAVKFQLQHCYQLMTQELQSTLPGQVLSMKSEGTSV
jgi:hypothetical protein